MVNEREVDTSQPQSVQFQLLSPKPFSALHMAIFFLWLSLESRWPDQINSTLWTTSLHRIKWCFIVWKSKWREKKYLLVFFPLVTAFEDLFLHQGLGILSFMLIGCLVARMGSKGNSHHKFIGGKLAPEMSVLEVGNSCADLVTWINNKNLWKPCSKIQDKSSWLNVHVYCLL